jgi:hypothetical protein
VVPQELEADVGEDSEERDNDEAKEHLAHGEDGGLVDYILVGALIDELEHLVGLDLAVAGGDRPLELLVVQPLLHLAHHCHVRLRHHDVRRSAEPELLEYLLVLV